MSYGWNNTINVPSVIKLLTHSWLHVVKINVCFHENSSYKQTNAWSSFGGLSGYVTNINNAGRAIAQAVGHWFPTLAARFRVQVRLRGVCSGKSGIGAGFLRVLRFPLPILIPPTAPHSSSIIRGWYIRPVSGWRTNWTQVSPHPKKLKKTQIM
jgi:hypothetical protein